MDQVQVDVQHRRRTWLLRHDVLLPDLIKQCLRVCQSYRQFEGMKISALYRLAVPVQPGWR